MNDAKGFGRGRRQTAELGEGGGGVVYPSSGRRRWADLRSRHVLRRVCSVRGPIRVASRGRPTKGKTKAGAKQREAKRSKAAQSKAPPSTEQKSKAKRSKARQGKSKAAQEKKAKRGLGTCGSSLDGWVGSQIRRRRGPKARGRRSYATRGMEGRSTLKCSSQTSSAGGRI